MDNKIEQQTVENIVKEELNEIAKLRQELLEKDNLLLAKDKENAELKTRNIVLGEIHDKYISKYTEFRANTNQTNQVQESIEERVLRLQKELQK